MKEDKETSTKDHTLIIRRIQVFPEDDITYRLSMRCQYKVETSIEN